MKINRVGVDLAKNVFQLHGVDQHGKTVWKRCLRRDKWLVELSKSVERGCEVGMEACAGAHHWARLLTAQGFIVKIIPPQYVTPYVKTNKNDANDAEAICEADKPYFVSHLCDPHRLPGKNHTQVDFASPDADTTALGHPDRTIMERVIRFIRFPVDSG